MKKVLLSAAVIGLVSALSMGAAMAEGGYHDGNKRAGMFFEKLDTDGDGVVTLQEFQAKSQERFAEMDKDGDGKITQDEAKAHSEAMKEKWKEKRKEWKDKRGDDAKSDE